MHLTSVADSTCQSEKRGIVWIICPVRLNPGAAPQTEAAVEMLGLSEPLCLVWRLLSLSVQMISTSD